MPSKGSSLSGVGSGGGSGVGSGCGVGSGYGYGVAKLISLCSKTFSKKVVLSNGIKSSYS